MGGGSSLTWVLLFTQTIAFSGCHAIIPSNGKTLQLLYEHISRRRPACRRGKSHAADLVERLECRQRLLMRIGNNKSIGVVVETIRIDSRGRCKDRFPEIRAETNRRDSGWNVTRTNA